MDSAKTFVNYFNKSYLLKDVKVTEGMSLKNEFLEEFVVFIPEILGELNAHLKDKDLNMFYHKLSGLKFLCEYSDAVNRYWYLMRAYSGGLTRLMENPSQQKAIEVYIYYYNKYGGRRVLKDENWFENHRWKFLDQLIEVDTKENLDLLIENSIVSLSEFYHVYKVELISFLRNVEKLM